MRGNTITMTVVEKRGKAAKTIPLYQYDYGQKLLIEGVELPEYYEVHFSNEMNGTSVTVLGDSTGVLIPDNMVNTGDPIYVWLYLHDTSYDGETEYFGIIPVIKRAEPTDITPTPEEQSLITQAIAALNNMEDDMSAQIQEAKAAKEAAQTAQAGAETAANTASGYVDTVTAAETSAQAAMTGAVAAQTAAETAATSAAASANNANNALADANNAKIAAVNAADAASTSATTASTASGNASNYATSAESAKVDAVAAKTAAEAAQTAAETAQGKAEDAQTAAETAQTAAETAQGKAEDAQTAAESAQTGAEGSAEDSEAYAVGTRNGVDVESDDPAYENNAKYYAEEAATVLADKLDAPATAGTAGQVLTSDGEGGQVWADPSGAIDDTAGEGDTDVTWSADKLTEETSALLNAIQGKYTKPSGGIPSSDMTQAVQTSLGKADTAYQKPNNGIPASDMASGVIPVLTDLLDDTAGENDTDKTWSADKLFKLKSFVEEASLSPAQIQTIVADGRASEFFSIGDIIIIPWTDYSPITAVTYDFPFVVANIADCVDDNGVTHHNALWLQAMVTTPQTIQFDAPEQIVATEETFQSGMYYYTKNADDSFTEQSVTAGDPIPTGTTYYKHYRTGISGRLRYGSNNYKESAIRQWLNSSGAKSAWWTAQHESDVAPTQHSSVPGYLTGFNDDWLSVIKPVEVKCYRNTSCDGGGWDTMYDRFFLPSLEEVYGSPQLSGEGVYFPYWKEETGLQSPSNGSSTDINDARKIPSVANKYGSAVVVRLRSATRSNTYTVWSVHSTGYLNGSSAYYSYRFLPACVIY